MFQANLVVAFGRVGSVVVLRCLEFEASVFGFAVGWIAGAVVAPAPAWGAVSQQAQSASVSVDVFVRKFLERLPALAVRSVWQAALELVVAWLAAPETDPDQVSSVGLEFGRAWEGEWEWVQACVQEAVELPVVGLEFEWALVLEVEQVFPDLGLDH